MAGTMQPAKSPPTSAVSPETQLQTMISQDQPKAPPKSMAIEDRPQSQQQPLDKPTQEGVEQAEEPSKERERTPTSEPSHKRREHSPPPPSHDREVTPDTSKVRSKESRKAEKKRKKESKHRRRSDSDQPRRDRSRREERSRSAMRPESPIERQSQVIQVEASETDDPPTKGESQLAIKDRPPRARPRFDPTKEVVVAQRIAEKKRVIQPLREHRRDPSTEGPPDREEERRMKRRPPLPPPATSMRQASSGHKPLSFVRPPPRGTGSASESSFVPSERGPLRLRVRVEDTPPQRQMPRRTLATPIGGSAPPRLETTAHRPIQGEYQGQSQVRDDRSSRWERSGEWHEQRDYPEWSRSRQWQGDQQWTERPRYQQERQDWGSTQGWTPGTSYRDTGSQSQWRDQQASG